VNKGRKTTGINGKVKLQELMEKSKQDRIHCVTGSVAACLKQYVYESHQTFICDPLGEMHYSLFFFGRSLFPDTPDA